MLYQANKSSKLKPVAFFSAKHLAPKYNHKIYNKELLAIVKALKEWHSKLQKMEQLFEIIIDYKNLQTFIIMKQLNQC